ncbi:MAG: tetratricopeptide repeat protein, partial [Planctomycetota bacterium]
MDAEFAYFFRQSIVRDGAYSLQPPSVRAWLHGLAFYAIEREHGERAPSPPQLNIEQDLPVEPHPTDNVALELSQHAHRALAVVSQKNSGMQTDLSKMLTLYLRRAAEHAENQFQNEHALHCWQRLSEFTRGTEQTACWYRAGRVAALSGKTERAIDLFERMLGAAHSAGDARTKGIAQGKLAVIYQNTGQTELAERSYSSALEIHREVGNRKFEGIELANQATLMDSAGHRQLAEDAYAKALAIYREIGARDLMCNVMVNMGSMYASHGQHDLAEANFDHVLELLKKTPDRRLQGIALYNLAGLYRSTGRGKECRQALEDALILHRAV